MNKKRKRLSRLIKIAFWIITGVAIAQELNKPEGEREWNGYVGGVVPYDFRIPTPARIRRRLWDPEGPMVSPQVFGAGWSPNFGRLFALATGRA